MSISQIVDCHRVANHTTPRQNAKTGNLTSSGSTEAELDIFEIIQSDDRASRRQGSLNAKALKPWEVKQVDGGEEGIGAGYSRRVDAMRFSDLSTYTTDSISQVDGEITIISLTQPVDSIHTDGSPMADSGGQYIFHMGDETEASTHLKAYYKRKAPEVGDKLTLRQNASYTERAGKVISSITYDGTPDLKYSEELTPLNRYFLKVTGKATFSNGDIIDGNYYKPNGGTATLTDSALYNQMGIAFRDDAQSFTNGGAYVHSFAMPNPRHSTEFKALGLMLDTGVLDHEDITSIDLKVEISPAIKVANWSNIQTGGNTNQQGQGFDVEGKATTEWEVVSVNESSNRMEIKRSDQLGESAMETCIISTDAGRWWDNKSRGYLHLVVEGKTDDDTDFDLAFIVDESTEENTKDEEPLNLLVIGISCEGVKVSRNGTFGAYATRKSCLTLADQSIKVGAKSNSPHETEINTALIKKERHIRHFEWLMFNKNLSTEDTLKVMRYLRCKYGYPWDNGNEQFGAWKRCEYNPVPKRPPTIVTCCFTTETGIAMVPTYVSSRAISCLAQLMFGRTTGYTDMGFGLPKVSTGRTGALITSSTYCEPQSVKTAVTGSFWQTKNVISVIQWGPFYYPSVTQSIHATHCFDENESIEGGVQLSPRAQGKTTTTIADMVGKHSKTEIIYIKPNKIITDSCVFAKDNKHTFRVTSATSSSRKGVLGTRYYVSVSGHNVFKRNDVLSDGSESTTGTTSARQESYKNGYQTLNVQNDFTLLAKKKTTKAFWTYWTYDTPVNATYTAVTGVTKTYTTKTTLYSATTTDTFYNNTKTSSNADGSTYVMAEDTDTSSYSLWVSQTSSSTYASTAESSTTTNTSWNVPAHSIGTASTRSVEYIEDKTFFGELSLSDQTQKWTSVSTRSTTAFGDHTSVVSCFVPYSNTYKKFYNLPLGRDGEVNLMDFVAFYNKLIEKNSTLASAYLQEWDNTYVNHWIKNNSDYTKNYYHDDPRRPLNNAFSAPQKILGLSGGAWAGVGFGNDMDGVSTFWTTQFVSDENGNKVYDRDGNGVGLGRFQYKTERVGQYIERKGQNDYGITNFDFAYEDYNRHTYYEKIMREKNTRTLIDQITGHNADAFTQKVLQRLMGATSSSFYLHTTYTSTNRYGATHVGMSTISSSRTWAGVPSSFRQKNRAVGTFKADPNTPVGRIADGSGGAKDVYRTEDSTYDPNLYYNRYLANSTTTECEDKPADTTGTYEQDPQDGMGNKFATITKRKTYTKLADYLSWNTQSQPPQVETYASTKERTSTAVVVSYASASTSDVLYGWMKEGTRTFQTSRSTSRSYNAYTSITQTRTESRTIKATRTKTETAGAYEEGTSETTLTNPSLVTYNNAC